MTADDSSTVTEIDLPDATLEGDLVVPEDASGVVVFAHGSGSSRHSPRNNFVAERLRERGLGTLLFDLLTEREDRSRETRFDIDLLTDRLVATTAWLRERPEASGRSLGYFGSSTGAAAAMRGAARRETDIDAVVSRGGRVDLAAEVADELTAPTLLIVGGDDDSVLELNRGVFEAFTAEADLRVVEGAGHLFEGEGELEAVADHAADWFVRHLESTA
ncbi:dienelactone hydrolase family protein [Natronorubrum daqingense]|uniref:Alpha/beta hydrolase n=1 Tax=Natronorubrum daqingense TaxID=588898 RepID=A0A1N7ENT3_9EURY|nr:dienelactone hydrolase family protein [Natronorubrum daqingense]APX97836.1 alpha/beta hydrolase [Natronorubrum daqingense]SIR89712.1 Alpha/beta superfamily hydrolase [Natronorubrum daqingense]